MAVRSRMRAAIRLSVAVAAAAALSACSGGAPAGTDRPTAARQGTAQTAATTTTAARPSTTTAATIIIAPTTTTTVDPGSLPQTTQLPSGSDPAFQTRIAELWQAILTGDASRGAPAFFPLSAYVQVKGISDPVHDYQTRLIPDYEADISALHGRIGSSAVFGSVSVPAAAEWIKPGVEYNKGSYWRVYGTTVHFLAGGQQHYFTIASMISWRGQWYVVHLSSIR